MTQIFFALNVWGHNLWPQTAEGVIDTQLIVENSATSIASFKYFILQHQVLHSATSSASFSYFKCFIQPTKLPLPPNAVESITQRSWIHHPAQSNPSPNEVVSLTQQSRIRHPAKSYPSPQWNVWTCAMTCMMRKRLTWWEPGCFWNYVPTYLLLRRDASFAASGRSKCCIGTQFSFPQLAMIPPLSSHLAKKRSLTR